MPRQLPTITILDVKPSDLRLMAVKGDGQTVEFRYQIRQEEEGVIDVYGGGTYRTQLPASLRQDLIAWVVSDIIPEINQKEGL